MKSPNSLPWYARKAGVPVERAEALWRKAVRETTAHSDWVGTSEFWGASESRFLELLEDEKNTLCAPNVETFMRSQHRMGLMPLLAAEEMFTAISANWQRFRNQMRKAA